LTLVIPVYNCGRRLAASLAELEGFLEAQPWPSELVLVDDHSAEATTAALEEFAARRPGTRLLRNEQNLGKGASVARGMLAGSGRYRVFTDADLAYPPSEVSRVLGVLESGADVAIACRVLPESRYLMSPSFFHYLYTRHLMSRAYNWLVRRMLLADVLDSQAGLKGFTARAAEIVFSRLTIPRFGFDVEALFIAQRHGLRVVQTPVQFHYDQEPTTVRFASEGVRMLGDLVRVRVNLWRGRYDAGEQ
jgi:dolichyl-phosphate beta-glucosyltransferase